jgi:hypothetical protein
MEIKSTLDSFTDNFGEVEEFLKAAGYSVVAQEDIERGEFSPEHGKKIAIFHAGRDEGWSDQYFELKPDGYFAKKSRQFLYSGNPTAQSPILLLEDGSIWGRLA